MNENQYDALVMSNDLGVTLGGLVEDASADELAALDQVRTGLFRIGEIDAQGARMIVQAIQGLAAGFCGTPGIRDRGGGAARVCRVCRDLGPRV